MDKKYRLKFLNKLLSPLWLQTWGIHNFCRPSLNSIRRSQKRNLRKIQESSFPGTGWGNRTVLTAETLPRSHLLYLSIKVKDFICREKTIKSAALRHWWKLTAADGRQDIIPIFISILNISSRNRRGVNNSQLTL